MNLTLVASLYTFFSLFLDITILWKFIKTSKQSCDFQKRSWIAVAVYGIVNSFGD